MSQINSQGLTWLEWRIAAGYQDENFTGHDGSALLGILLGDWRAGVNPALHVAVKEDEKAENT